APFSGVPFIGFFARGNGDAAPGHIGRFSGPAGLDANESSFLAKLRKRREYALQFCIRQIFLRSVAEGRRIGVMPSLAGTILVRFCANGKIIISHVIIHRLDPAAIGLLRP
ncbi:hypothetical protein, partial [Sinorhizobium medicae]|uniref:hypothetical protein n=1 Tax=Sinorhizobium medicae TaxID=110321 RepID=UPI001AECA62E